MRKDDLLSLSWAQIEDTDLEENHLKIEESVEWIIYVWQILEEAGKAVRT